MSRLPQYKLDFRQTTFLVYFTMFLPKSAQSWIKAHNSKGNFRSCVSKLFINHRTIIHDQMMKKGLQKYGLHKEGA
jgi:hypothetical protein